MILFAVQSEGAVGNLVFDAWAVTGPARIVGQDACSISQASPMEDSVFWVGKNLKRQKGR